MSLLSAGWSGLLGVDDGLVAPFDVAIIYDIAAMVFLGLLYTMSASSAPPTRQDMRAR